MKDKDNRITGGTFPRIVRTVQTHDLLKMSERHHQIIRYNLLGYKNNQIAEKLNITAASVGVVLNSSIVQIKREQLRGAQDKKTVDIMNDINEILPAAVLLLKNIVNEGEMSKDTPQASLQAKVSKDLLGIAGYSPVNKSESRNLNMALTTDEVESMVNDAKQLGFDCVEAEIVENKPEKSEE